MSSAITASPASGSWKHLSIYGEEVGTPPIQLFPNMQIFRYAHRGNGKTWYVRFYREDLKRYKPLRSLKTSDLDQAKMQACILFGEIKTKLDHGIDDDAIEKTIDILLDEWIDQQTKRYKSGEIKVTLWRNKKRTSDLYIRNYIRWKKWDNSKPEKIPIAGWSDYRYWRVTDGWKLSESSQLKKPPKDSTVNLEIGFIREWYGDKMIPEGFANQKPTIKKVRINTDDLDANPPFTKSDYSIICQAMAKWVHDPEVKIRYKKRRIVLAHFFMCSMRVGWRPESEGLQTKWNQVKIWEEMKSDDKKNNKLKNSISDEGLIVYEKNQKMINNNLFGSSHMDNEVNLNATIRIKDTKNKRIREADFPAGKSLLYLRNQYQDWHDKDPVNCSKPMQSDYLFHLPENAFKYDKKTKKRTNHYVGSGSRNLSYTSVSNAWKQILKLAFLVNDPNGIIPPYTIRSCRSWYVTDRLRNGTDIYLVCKATGHDIRTCKRHYERLSLKEKRNELTKSENTPYPNSKVSNYEDQDALSFTPTLEDEEIQKNEMRIADDGVSKSEQIKMLESLLKKLRSE